MQVAPLLPARAGVSFLALVTLGSAAAQAPGILMNATGGSAGDYFGMSVSAAGDVNRDGFADVIVGAPFDDEGSARVLSGADGMLLYELRGNSPYDAFGIAVSDAGDVDDDGWPDLIVGAYLDDAFGVDAGSACVFSGRDFTLIHTLPGPAAGAEFGYSVSGAGDVNMDGFADVIVGAPYDRTLNGIGVLIFAGSATVFSGLDGTILFKWYGDGHDDHFGNSVNDAGDVNDDGWADLIVGAPWDDNSFSKAGMARVFSTNPAQQGDPILYSFDGDGLGYELGWSVCGAGDLNGDGHDDLLVGQPEDKVFGDDAGSAVLYSGIDGATMHTFYGDGAYSYFGFAVSATDVDHDGINDLIIGEPRHDVQAYHDEGAVHVYSGANYQGSQNLLFSLFGSGVNDRLGRSVSFAGDVNGDGFQDFVCGAPWAEPNGPMTGYANVYCGSPGQGATSTYGVGCPPALPLTLSYSGTPRLGQTLNVEVGNGPAAPTIGWIVFGFTNGQPYPLSLGVLGLQGCTQYQRADIIATVSMVGGAATFPLTVPPVSAPCGLLLYNQAIALDGGAPFGVRVSNAGSVIMAQ